MKIQQKYQKEKNILELNPHAPIIQELNKIVEVLFIFIKGITWSEQCQINQKSLLCSINSLWLYRKRPPVFLP
jgi:hypothetical protein